MGRPGPGHNIGRANYLGQAVRAIGIRAGRSNDYEWPAFASELTRPAQFPYSGERHECAICGGTCHHFKEPKYERDGSALVAYCSECGRPQFRREWPLFALTGPFPHDPLRIMQWDEPLYSTGGKE